MRKSAQRASAVDRPETFQLKGGLFPMTLLDVKIPDPVAIKAELTEKVFQSPAFFQQSPIVFGFEHLSDAEQNAIDLSGLCTICRELNLLPTAVRGANAYLQDEATRLMLAIMPKSRQKTAENPVENEPTAGNPAAAPAEPSAAQIPAETGVDNSGNRHSGEAIPTKIITTPIRSGQQIYARGDLIIMAAVSAGAEVLAEGNIHIYGALRGRALAGVKGNESARIFCSSQEAELVAVAGQFMVDEILRTNRWKEAVQIYLEGGRIQISPLPKHG